jgi:DNA polymerase-3 subunit epsilon
VQQRPAPLALRVTDADLVAHAQFIARLGDKAIWQDYT